MTAPDPVPVPQPPGDETLAEVWAARQGDGFGYDAYAAAARRLGQIDASWARSATSCSSTRPCYPCCLRALRALEAAAAAPGVSQ